MKSPGTPTRTGWSLIASGVALLIAVAVSAADHNDPNAVNSIFSDIDPDPADLYDLFGFPTKGSAGEERVLLALTFAPIPEAGKLDPDLLYRLMVYPGARVARNPDSGGDLQDVLAYASAVKEKYAHAHPAEIRVYSLPDGTARLDFIGFRGGTFSHTTCPDGTNSDDNRGTCAGHFGTAAPMQDGGAARGRR